METQKEIVDALQAALKTATAAGAGTMPYEAGGIAGAMMVVALCHYGETVLENQEPAVRAKLAEITLEMLKGPLALVQGINHLLKLDGQAS